jgi:hypothetical protein
MEDRLNILSFTDWHVPYEDKRAINIAFAFAEAIQPQIIIVHEAHDFYSLSKYDKNPKRINSLQKEIDKVNSYFTKLRMLCPNARIILLDSNHLDRLRRFLWSKAPALDGLRSLAIDRLLELNLNNIEFKEDFVFRKFLFKHGERISQQSAYTARKEFDKENMNGMSGHTHRLGQYYTTKRGGSYTWIECGCLCKLKPEYVKGTPDWQHGFGLVSFEPDGSHFFATPIPIINYQIQWGNITI